MLARPAKFNKYSAVKTTVDGIEFASKKEAKRYSELKLLERAGEISGLTLQPVYILLVNGVRVGRYTPDFLYHELAKKNYSAKSKLVVEECKGFKVRDYVLRRNVFRALNPDIEHREV